MISFYEIDDDYIEYLRKFDKKVLTTKDEDRKHTRKYIGIMFHNREYKYFIPLSSYKPDTYDDMYEIFSGYININTHFNTIENAYITFKLLVNEYLTL